MVGEVPDLARAPFAAALGAALADVSPAVRRHLVPARGLCIHRGVLRRMWRRGIAGRLVSGLLHLRGDDRGAFRLENELVEDGADCAMTWRRTHPHRGRAEGGIGLVHWEAPRRVLVDRIGAQGWLEVELVPRVEGGTVSMDSGRQRLCLGAVRLPLPRWLFGSAATREWEEPDGRIGLSLVLRHPLLGEYAGYEAVFAPENAP